MTDITTTLKHRNETYGDFGEHAAVTQQMKHACRTGQSYTRLSVAQKEALDMICHKIGRIVNGDPNYIESWRDITGYTQLVVNQLFKTNGATDGRVISQIVIDGELVDMS